MMKVFINLNAQMNVLCVYTTSGTINLVTFPLIRTVHDNVLMGNSVNGTQ